MPNILREIDSFNFIPSTTHNIVSTKHSLKFPMSLEIMFAFIQQLVAELFTDS